MQVDRRLVPLLCGRVRQTLCFEVHHKGLQLRSPHRREKRGLEVKGESNEVELRAKVVDLIIHLTGSGRIFSAPCGYQSSGRYTEHSSRPSPASD
ncbi:hypothetical protein CHARACLAT_010602 [Characodon lateralis]|uniref:Uncharacterized protein n=1 Tax=Characodon lateralis TaxID=208331 RepID=A0ABU7CM69_9TELE|nr:hypothetical protein [Characodon lateralis]